MFVNNAFCQKHQQATRHVNGECSPCLEERERKEKSEWESMPIDKKLEDLYLRIKMLEKGSARF
jgi:hypothetical protein